MRTFPVRAFALVGALCGALTALFAQTPSTPTTAVPGNTTTGTAGTAPAVTPTLPTQARRPSLMIRRGAAELEWRTTYSHSSKNAIFIDGVAVVPIVVVGQIGVQHVRKDSLTTSVAGRYGLANNLLGELKLPLRYENDQYSTPDVSPTQENSISSLGIGDIEGTLYYQLPRKKEEDIRWVANLGVKSATGDDSFQVDTHNDVALGTGFWNTKLGLTGIKVVDPAAVYWSVCYTYAFRRDNIALTTTNPQNGETTITYVDIKPGDAIDVGGGFAYAINQRLSVNTGVSITYNTSSSANGKHVANTAITSASLRLGAVWLTEHQKPVDIGLSIGLTDDSPDFSLELRKSYKF